MLSDRSLFVEIGAYQMNKHGKSVCGDTFLTRKLINENRYVAVLSDGLGSGIKANVLSTMTASMALNFVARREPIHRTAQSIMNTLPVDSVRNISYSTFSIADIYRDGEVSLIEYDNPKALRFSGSEPVMVEREAVDMLNPNGQRALWSSAFKMAQEDRLIVFSDGVNQSGMGTKQMPFGWGERGVNSFIEATIASRPTISARDLARLIVKRSEMNDLGRLTDDTSCMVVYLRQPRRLLICSGPPYNEQRDRYLADVIDKYQGKKIVCGGTTSNIVSRELKRPIHVDLKTAAKGSPPISTMEGVDLMTEGIITLGSLVQMLELGPQHDPQGKGGAYEIYKLIMESDCIDFLVGTKINIAHQDPSLPVELEIRRNVIKKIAQLLEDSFLKQVYVEFV